MQINQSGEGSERVDEGILKSVEQIQVVAHLTESNLDPYKGMKRLQIKVNGETREIYLDNENLRVDSSTWRVTKIGEHKVKVNPESDIIEYLDGAEKGEQLFGYRKAAEREAKKLGKRLPLAWDDYNEFQAITDEVGTKEFMKVFPGMIRKMDVIRRGNFAFFWADSGGINLDNYSQLARGVSFYTPIAIRSGGRKPNDQFWEHFDSYASIRLVKDKA